MPPPRRGLSPAMVPERKKHLLGTWVLPLPAIVPAFCGPHPRSTLGCMNLTDEDLQEFSQIWSEEFHETISIAEAREHASALLELYSVLARPTPPELSSEN